MSSAECPILEENQKLRKKIKELEEQLTTANLKICELLSNQKNGDGGKGSK